MNIILLCLIYIQFLCGLAHQVSVYYGNWKAYDRGFPICEVPFEKIDRLYYVFSDPNSGECNFADTYIDLESIQSIDGNCSSALEPDNYTIKGNMYQLLVNKRRYPKLKVFFVIGGMIYASAMHDYIMTNDTAKMQGYVSSCVQMYNNYSYAFDGIDIDYEYPCLYNDTNCGDITPEFNEKELFVKYIQEFRNQLGPKDLISIATSNDPQKIQALDLVQLDKIVDFYNIMTYDFTSGNQGDAYSGHHTQPYVNYNDPIPDRKLLSADLAGKYYVQNGASPSKINIGVAFYGRGFMIQPNISVNKGPFFKSLGAIKFGTSEVGMIDYYNIMNNYTNDSSLLFDNSAMAPYIINNNIGLFITYDDERSIQEKVNIVERNGYGGLFAYELTGDDSNFTLLNTMRRNASTENIGFRFIYGFKIYLFAAFLVLVL